jgi:hypothetical protein
MTDLNNLIERLLDRDVCSIHHNSCRNDMVCEEAATALSALMSERDAYREALEEIAADAWVSVDKPKKMYRGWRAVAVERIDIARAALAAAIRSDDGKATPRTTGPSSR